MQIVSIISLCLAGMIRTCFDYVPVETNQNTNMVFVEGGSFTMGSDMNTIDSLTRLYSLPKNFLQTEFPPHNVKISGFYIDKFEVTNAEFKLFIDQNPFWQKANIPDSLHNGHYLEHWTSNNFPAGEENYPVYNVSWYAAVAYAQWVKKRLPTEAEWEFAAGSRNRYRNFPWGNANPDSSRCNFNKIYGKAIEVGRYAPNDLGIYDLAGNVWEYTLDEWSPTFYQKSAQENPVNGVKYFSKQEFLAIKSRRVIRGGSWGGSAINLRIAFRDSHPVNGAGNHVGFRCVRDLTNTQP